MSHLMGNFIITTLGNHYYCIMSTDSYSSVFSTAAKSNCGDVSDIGSKKEAFKKLIDVL